MTDDHVLASWRPFSLQTRCRLFETRFPDRLITVNTLRKIYKLKQIKQRVIHVNYQLTAAKMM